MKKDTKKGHSSMEDTWLDSYKVLKISESGSCNIYIYQKVNLSQLKLYIFRQNREWRGNNRVIMVVQTQSYLKIKLHVFKSRKVTIWWLYIAIMVNRGWTQAVDKWRWLFKCKYAVHVLWFILKNDSYVAIEICMLIELSKFCCYNFISFLLIQNKA